MATFLLMFFVLLSASYPAAVNAAPAGSQQQGSLSTNIVTDAINVRLVYMIVEVIEIDNLIFGATGSCESIGL